MRINKAKTMVDLRSAIAEVLLEASKPHTMTHPDAQAIVKEHCEYWLKQGLKHAASDRTIKSGSNFPGQIVTYLRQRIASIILEQPTDHRLSDDTWRELMHFKWLYKQITA